MTSLNTDDRHFHSFRGVKALKSSHPGVRKIKRNNDEPSIHGNKVWRSSFALIDYLHKNPIPEGSRVLDIGCGWGLTGIWLAKQFNAEVISIDADDAVEPYLKLQCDINNVSTTFRQARFEALKKKDFSGVELVVGADICFWDELTKPLYKMIKRAWQAGVTRTIVADPGRPPFWALAEKAGEKLDGDVIAHTVTRPRKSEKQLLIVSA